MASRQAGPLLALFIIGTLGVIATLTSLESGSGPSTQRFDDRSFSAFQSTYGSLSGENAARRASYLRQLIEIGERAELSPNVAKHLEEFCRSILASDEVGEVKAEAQLALNALEKRRERSADAQARGLATAP